MAERLLREVAKLRKDYPSAVSTLTRIIEKLVETGELPLKLPAAEIKASEKIKIKRALNLANKLRNGFGASAQGDILIRDLLGSEAQEKYPDWGDLLNTLKLNTHDLNLMTSSFKAMTRVAIPTIEDIRNRSEEELQRINHVGPVRAAFLSKVFAPKNIDKF